MSDSGSNGIMKWRRKGEWRAGDRDRREKEGVRKQGGREGGSEGGREGGSVVGSNGGREGV